MNLLIFVALRECVQPCFIFKCAYDYYELRRKPTQMRKEYQEYMARGIMPQQVQDFCLDIINGEVTLPKQPQLIGRSYGLEKQRTP